MDAMQVFDRALLRRRRDRAADTVHRVAPILEDCADRLLDRLDDTTRRFSRALDLGGRGVVAPRLRERGIDFVVSADLSPAMAQVGAQVGARMGARMEAARAGGLAVAADEEVLPFAPESFDLIVASLSLHWVNDLPGALIQIRRALAPDGLFLASLPGLGTLQPLRQALAEAETALRGGLSPRISPFPELRDAAGLLQRAGFALPVADAEEVGLAYRTAFALLADLRAAGEANAVLARDPRTPPRALFPMAAATLSAAAAEEIRPGLRLLMLTGWAPHSSQQKPARPGSATHRLADALGGVERKLGEKPGG
jgi:SAM-dependent methyltransferase